MVLLGVEGLAAKSISDRARRLAKAWRAAEAPVRFVIWSVETRTFRILDPKALADLGLGEASDPRLIPPASWPGLEKATCLEGDWLLVPQTLRLDLARPDLVEVDAIMEARRLGLLTAFVFNGADPLRDPEDAGLPAQAHDQYMQALLLADAVLPVSEAAASDLTAILAQHQLARWTPALRTIVAPDADAASEPPAFAGYARRIEDTLRDAADVSRRITALYYWTTPTGASSRLSAFAGRLARALSDRGVRLIAVEWSPVRRCFVSRSSADLSADTIAWEPWVDVNASDAPRWVLAAGDLDPEHFGEARFFATAHDLRLAVVLGEPDTDATASSPSDPERRRFEALVRADKVLSVSEERHEAFYRFLLSWRGKAHSAEHRFKSLPAPAEAPTQLPDDGWADYARRLCAELAIDRLSDGMQATRSSTDDVYQSFPNLARRPKLSICLSTYNRAGWLSQNLKNIFSQIPSHNHDLEVLVVDNASPDNTSEIVRPYLNRSDFRYLRNLKNVGMLGNLSVTAQRARGEYIWILGDDDLTRAGCIDAVLRVLHRNPGIGLVYLNYGYTSEPDPLSVTDLPAFLDAYNVLEPACADDLAPVKHLAAKNENFYTAIYSHVYRRDHGTRAYCQDTSGRIFSTMLTCIPTSYYVLNYMPDEDAYWIGEPSLVVNSNVSWVDYGPLFDLEQLPRAWDLAERHGAPAGAVDRRRANRLWLVKLMWKDIFENDRANNAPYFSAPRVLMRLKHLPQIDLDIEELRSVYTRAHLNGHPAAAMLPSDLFAAFR